ncbi:unnamed protein product [Triticum turgidum subsp. durum]|uniref:Uncharacterized protein n=1 Tax=Triticum turgidum subsp. durum TaxID=4567 RepID=A0A9R1Q633_TRITD|nr:unnamed protein product [Triticum turgidum subsp. durum]
METGGGQSAKKQRLDLVLASPAPVKQEMVVLMHEAGEIVPAIQAPTKEAHLGLTVLQCHFCSRPLKPPVHQVRSSICSIHLTDRGREARVS